MKKYSLVLLMVLLPFITGCFSPSGYFNSMSSDLMRSIKGDFSRDTEFALGPVTLSLAGLFIDEEEDSVTARLIEDISRVEICVYNRHSGEQAESNYRILKKIDRKMRMNGWTYFVKNCSKDEMTAVYVNRNLRDGIKKLFVISLDKQELVMVQLQGNLERVFETAVHDRGLSYNN